MTCEFIWKLSLSAGLGRDNSTQNNSQQIKITSVAERQTLRQGAREGSRSILTVIISLAGWKQAANSPGKFVSPWTPERWAKLKPVIFLRPPPQSRRSALLPRVVAPACAPPGFHDQVSVSPQKHLLLLVLEVHSLRTLAGPQPAQKYTDVWEIRLSLPELDLVV